MNEVYAYIDEFTPIFEGYALSKDFAVIFVHANRLFYLLPLRPLGLNNI